MPIVFPVADDVACRPKPQALRSLEALGGSAGVRSEIESDFFSYRHVYLHSQFPLPKERREEVTSKIRQREKQKRSLIHIFQECWKHWAVSSGLLLTYFLNKDGISAIRNLYPISYLEFVTVLTGILFLFLTIWRQVSFWVYIYTDQRYLEELLKEDDLTYNPKFTPPKSWPSERKMKNAQAWLRRSRFKAIDFLLMVAASALNAWLAAV